MSIYPLQYKAFSNNAVLIEWPQQIEENILRDIQAFQAAINNNLNEFVIECIPAYASLTVLFKSISFYNLCDQLKAIYENVLVTASYQNNCWQLPVCYHPTLGFDLENYSNAIGLSIEEIIHIHTQTIYTVYFIGFLPGFLYLGNLEERLFLNRKSKPLLKVPKGSVGIGGQQTGIYPQSSPGGWHIVGNCPVQLFNVNENPPAVFKAGDKVEFYNISLKDYRKNNFKLTKTPYA